ncbi:MAG TPA: hypothetical protein VF713_22120 [Thermoanaerobaculia bacterium]
MSDMRFFAPLHRGDAFNCPFCNVYARQAWWDGGGIGNDGRASIGVQLLTVCRCEYCGKVSIWLFEKMVYPVGGGVAPANTDLREDIIRDY